MSIRIILRLTVREAARRKVLWGLLILGVVFLVLYGLGLLFVQDQFNRVGGPRGVVSMDDIYNFLVMAGLYAANFLMVMLSVLIPVDTLSGEINSGTIQAIAVKPLSRRDILLGKWLGFAVMLGLCTLLLVGGVIVLTALITHYTPPNPLTGLLLLFLEALVLLSVSLLGGTRLSTLANGVLGFGLFGLAFIGGWIEQIGGFINSNAAESIGRVASFIMPTDALWRRTVAEMSQGFNRLAFMFLGSSAPDPGMVLYALVFAGIVLLLALRSFQRRDL
jgi:Cu-processing system permease protein